MAVKDQLDPRTAKSRWRQLPDELKGAVMLVVLVLVGLAGLIAALTFPAEESAAEGTARGDLHRAGGRDSP